MDDYGNDRHPLSVWGAMAGKIIVYLFLIAVIAGAVYATWLPSIYFHHHPKVRNPGQ